MRRRPSLFRLTAAASARRVFRWALAWFLLSLGAAIASPLVNPQAMEVVCSAMGAVKVIVQSGDGTVRDAGAVQLDCPLCLPMAGPPPPALQAALPQPLPLGRALRPVEAARIAAATAAPLPARGPPSP